MVNAVVSIFVEDEGYQIPYTSIKSFQIFSSINSSYPYGELRIDDPEGKFLNYLAIKPGNKIKIVAGKQEFKTSKEGAVAEANKTFDFTPLRVVGMYSKKADEMADPSQVQVSSLGGEIIIRLAHPWALFSDYSNRSYQKKISSIISEILQNPRRGGDFSFSKKKIDETDDDGTIIRFKLAESESQFIDRKLLPYAAIHKLPAYSFIDETGTFHLHNFKDMFSAEPKLVILPKSIEGYSGLLTQDDAKMEIQSILDASWNIGEHFVEQLGKFKRHLYVEETNSRAIFKAQMDYAPPIPGYVLIKQDYLDSLSAGATSAAAIPFREFDDAVRMEASSVSIMDKFFQIDVVTEFSIDTVSVGMPVKIKAAGDPYNTAHWLSGKWLVTATKHYGREGNYASVLTLARPAIDNLPTSVSPERLLKKF